MPLDSKAKMFIGRSSSVSFEVSPQIRLAQHKFLSLAILRSNRREKLVPHV